MSMKEIVKRILKSSLIGKAIYPIVQSCYRAYAIPRRRARLQKYGAGILRNVHECLTAAKIDYHVDFGTLLGVVRENGFIKHDDDIDVTIPNVNESPKRVLEVLTGAGFSFIHAMQVHGRTVEFSVRKDGLSVDFFFYMPVNRADKVGLCGVYFKPDVKYDSPDQNNYRVWYFPSVTKVEQRQFKGETICVPTDAEARLEFEYGKNWRSPDEKWTGDELKGRYEVMLDFALRVLTPDPVN